MAVPSSLSEAKNKVEMASKADHSVPLLSSSVKPKELLHSASPLNPDEGPGVAHLSSNHISPRTDHIQEIETWNPYVPHKQTKDNHNQNTTPKPVQQVTKMIRQMSEQDAHRFLKNG